jgi:1-phosphofructokinase family hexose kinase
LIHLLTLNPALDFFFKVQKPRQGKIGLSQHSYVEAGGKALNIARFMKKWGIPRVVWLGAGGGKHPSNRLYRNLLEEEGLTARFLESDVPVRSNLVVNSGQGAAKYNHPGFRLKGKILEPMIRKVRPGDFLILTGRLPLGLSVDFYKKALRRFGRRGVFCFLDTSGKPLANALRGRPWFFKVNLFEISQALNLKISNVQQVSGIVETVFLARGLNFGVITDGARGAIVWKNRKIFRVVSHVRKPKGLVVGAGDAFLAGFLKGLCEKKSLEDCARLGAAAGAVVAKYGIQGFNPRLVSKQLKKVCVKNMKPLKTINSD